MEGPKNNSERREFVSRLMEIMPRLGVDLSGPNARDIAQGLVVQQSSRWDSLQNILERRHDTASRYMSDSIRLLRSSVVGPSIVALGDGVTVKGPLPIISRDFDTEFERTATRFPRLVFAYIIYASRTTVLGLDDRNLIALGLASAIVELRELLAPEPPSDWELEVARIRELISELQIKGKDLIGNLTQSSLNAEKQIQTIASEEKERKREWQVEKRSAVEGIRREALEFAKIESSVHLWKSKARWHLAAFWVSALLFAVTLIVTPYEILERGLPFISELAKNFSGDKEYLGLALLIIPALAVAWLLRFVARIAIQNLALAQDARQRDAQIVTYLRLLGDSSQPITKDERVLALSAIFRPLVGQGTDDVNPPTIADLLREAIEKATNQK